MLIPLDNGSEVILDCGCRFLVKHIAHTSDHNGADVTIGFKVLEVCSKAQPVVFDGFTYDSYTSQPGYALDFLSDLTADTH